MVPQYNRRYPLPQPLRRRQTDTALGSDIASFHQLIEQYAKAVDTVDLNLISQIWSHSPEVSFIYPLGEEHGFDASSSRSFSA